MRGNLAAFLAACDGASDCTGACKEAFYSKYAGCVRGYVPILVDGSFRNATLKAALDLCAPNSRNNPLPLHFDVAVDTVRSSSALHLAAVTWAIEVATQDPQLLVGFSPEITFDAWYVGGGLATSDMEMEWASVAVGNMLRRGIDETSIVIGPISKSAIPIIARALAQFGAGMITITPTVYTANPVNKPLFPYLVGALASGIKILNIFGAIIATYNFTDILMVEPETDETFDTLNPILNAQGFRTHSFSYADYKPGLEPGVQTKQKRDVLKMAKRTGIRAIGTSDFMAPSVRDFALALCEEKMCDANMRARTRSLACTLARAHARSLARPIVDTHAHSAHTCREMPPHALAART